MNIRAIGNSICEDCRICELRGCGVVAAYVFGICSRNSLAGSRYTSPGAYSFSIRSFLHPQIHSHLRDTQLWTSYLIFRFLLLLRLAVLGCKMIVRRRLLEDYELIGLAIGVVKTID